MLVQISVSTRPSRWAKNPTQIGSLDNIRSYTARFGQSRPRRLLRAFGLFTTAGNAANLCRNLNKLGVSASPDCLCALALALISGRLHRCSASRDLKPHSLPRAM